MPIPNPFSFLTDRLPAKRAAASQYIALVEQSRNPFFYKECAVPDTLDGRFDIILLHIFLALRGTSPTDPQARRLLEVLFDDMDRSLREMGVGDMGVSNRIRKMAEAAFGRLEHYRMADEDDAQMREALVRNIYRGDTVPPEAVTALQNYIRDYH